MENNQDPKDRIYEDPDEVQKEIDDAVKTHIKEIKKEVKKDAKNVKSEMKSLKKSSKESLENYKECLEKNDDPALKEKMSVAEDVHKVVEKNIEDDYQRTLDKLARDKEYRISSIKRMYDE